MDPLTASGSGSGSAHTMRSSVIRPTRSPSRATDLARPPSLGMTITTLCSVAYGCRAHRRADQRYGDGRRDDCAHEPRPPNRFAEPTVTFRPPWSSSQAGLDTVADPSRRSLLHRAATCRSRSSLPVAATSWTPMGRPSRLSASGRLIAGCPDTLNGAVNGPNSKMPRSHERMPCRGSS